MSTADPSLLKLLVQLTRSVEQDLEEKLRAELDDRLRPAHYAVFRYLAPTGSRIGDLADAAGMTQQSMGELVTHLERCGYLERRPDPTDRRARLVTTTASGHTALTLAATHITAIEHRLREAMGAPALTNLRHLLERAQQALASSG
ncbi:MarR family winged helix-turn-helix transcriptional regulator [Nocardia sp. CDC159]|uniref:MarR family winged helix-turn-helix transcriptional regulator n=1 Tax=Nocardia pulmonis TaxID=2951408 RepID=A0A9X2J1M5_9NOCA|nr:MULTISPECIES: MarR family winged helix-turn-helix transcriptional regulator [Nocardia]MCM6777176.1 MarR family winged helix-turn-helix transcriptional regulator [Nocardia pulmonis]MCM6790061.1 MarR family winged helix-turn-helix transcriptional regulator [Nocardia sp. CDC159]